MGWGDELIAAGQAKAMHDKTHGPVVIVDGGGRRRWHEAWEGLPFIVRADAEIPSAAAFITCGSGKRHYFRSCTVEGGYVWAEPVCKYPPVLALSSKEKAVGDQLREQFGPYVVINPAAGQFAENRDWGFQRFQEVVALSAGVTFVQCPGPGEPALAGVRVVPGLGFREASGALAGAEALVTNHNGMQQAARALGIPAVVIFGGSHHPDQMGYAEHVNLYSDRPGSPCGKIRPCAHCEAAMADITPAAVLAGLKLALAKRRAA